MRESPSRAPIDSSPSPASLPVWVWVPLMGCSVGASSHALREACARSRTMPVSGSSHLHETDISDDSRRHARLGSGGYGLPSALAYCPGVMPSVLTKCRCR